MSEKQVATHLQPWRFQADSVRAGVLNPDGRFRLHGICSWRSVGVLVIAVPRGSRATSA